MFSNTFHCTKNICRGVVPHSNMVRQDQKTKFYANVCERFFQNEHDSLLFRSKMPKPLYGHVRMSAYATTPLI